MRADQHERYGKSSDVLVEAFRRLLAFLVHECTVRPNTGSNERGCVDSTQRFGLRMGRCPTGPTGTVPVACRGAIPLSSHPPNRFVPANALGSADQELALQAGQVSFQWKDYSRQRPSNSRVMTVPADEFIRRFLLHTLPPGFQRIRHFGFLANCHRQDKLTLCRALLTVPIPDLLPQPATLQSLRPIPEKPIGRCPECGIGMMIRIQVLPAFRWPALSLDSSC
jgi:Putative transposase